MVERKGRKSKKVVAKVPQTKDSSLSSQDQKEPGRKSKMQQKGENSKVATKRGCTKAVETSGELSPKQRRTQPRRKGRALVSKSPEASGKIPQPKNLAVVEEGGGTPLVTQEPLNSQDSQTQESVVGNTSSLIRSIKWRRHKSAELNPATPPDQKQISTSRRGAEQDQGKEVESDVDYDCNDGVDLGVGGLRRLLRGG